MINVDTVAFHMKLDAIDSAERAYIQNLINAVTSYVTKITEYENDESSAEYEIACLLYIAHLYNNRELATEYNLAKVPYGFSALIQSIRPARGFF